MNFWYQPAIPRVRYSAGPLFRGSAIPQFHCTALYALTMIFVGSSTNIRELAHRKYMK
jgi:hypothetical protein